MAKPITWRNIAGPSFQNSALGQGVEAFRLAGAGFSDLTDSLFKTQDRIDKGYTNQAIKQSLETGQVDPNLNPRADSAAVYEALLGKQKFESDLETAESKRADLTSQIGLREEEIKDARYRNSDEWRALEERATKAEIGADEAQSSYNSWKLKFDQRQDEEAQLIKTQARDLESQLVSGRQGIYQQYLQANPGDETGARLAAQEWSESPEARQALEAYATDKKYMPEAWDLSTWGERDALRDQTLANLTEKRIEREEVRAEAENNRFVAEINGDLGLTIVDEQGNARAGTKQELKSQKMGSYTEAISKIQNHGINISQLNGIKGTSPEAAAINLGREKFPNASLLAGAIEPYIADDGEFDYKGFNKLLADAGPRISMNRVNEVRKARGLPPIQGTESKESGGPGAQEVLGGPVVQGVATKPATAGTLNSYRTRIAEAEQFMENLPADADPRGVDALRRALIRAQSEGKVTQGELPGLEENLQIFENIMRRFTNAEEQRRAFDAAQ